MTTAELQGSLQERGCSIVEEGGRFALVYPHGYTARKTAHDLCATTLAQATAEAWIWLHPERLAAAGIAEVQRIVAAGYGFATIAFCVKDRSEPLATARRVAMALAREITGASTDVVGAAFERDRGTVIAAQTSVRDQCDIDRAFAARVGSLRAACLTALHP